MAKLTREQRAEQAAVAERTKKANDFRKQVQRMAALRVWDEKLAWTGDNENERAVQALWTMVRDYEQCTADLKKQLLRMRDTVNEGLTRLETNETEPLRYSNPMASPGSDIEQLATRRKALADGITHLSYATGYYVPQVHSARFNEWRDRLVSIEVLETGGGYGVRSTVKAEPLVTTWLMSDGTFGTDGHVYDTAEAAWLAAQVAVGDRSW